MDAVVTDSDVSLMARNYLANWEAGLGLGHEQETAICNTFHSNYEQQKREGLHKWKRNKGDGATYHALITAAESAKDQLLAHGVKALVDGMFMYTSCMGEENMVYMQDSQRYMHS